MIAAIAVTFFAYRIGLQGPFLLDDEVNLTETELAEVSPAELGAQLFSVNWPYPGARGLTRASFALTRYISGDGAWPFKYQNLMLHLVNGLLLFWLLLLLMAHRPPGRNGLNRNPEQPDLESTDPSPDRHSGRNPGPSPIWLAAIISTLWLLHPLQASTVLYSVQRLVILSTLFMLAALVAYTKGRLLALHRPLTGVAVAVVGVLVFTALGLMSKETAVLTPALIGLVELFILRAPAHQRTSGPIAAVPLLFATLWLLPLLLGALFAALRPELLLNGYEMREYTPAQRLLTELHVLLFYLKQILIPLPSHMSLFQDAFPTTRSMDLGTAAVLLLHTGLLLFAVMLRKRAPWIGFGILWFYLCHALESTIVPLELVFEHRNYLALLGPTLIVVVLIANALRAPAIRRFAPVIVAATVLLLAFNTHARALVWSNLELMLLSDYERQPTSTRVLAGLTTLRLQQGARDDGMRYLRELQALSPLEPAPFLGEIQMQCGERRVDATLFRAALSRLGSGIVSAFSANSLRDLVDGALRGGCPALTTDQLRLLLSAADGNGRFGPGVACHVQELNTRFFIEQRDRAAARAHLQKALDACSRLNNLYLEGLINVLLVFSTDRGHLSWTLELLSSTARTADKTDITDAFPDWIGAEYITPAGIARLRAEGQ